MNPAHFHLLINHFPIIGTLLAIFIILFGILLRRTVLTHTGLFLLIAMAGLTFPVMGSGEVAEEVVEKLGIDHQIIHEHEEMAETAALLMYGLGVLALISLILSLGKKGIARILNVLTLLYAIGVFAMMARAGNSGGEIRHAEIRKDFKSEAENSEKKIEKKTEKGDD